MNTIAKLVIALAIPLLVGFTSGFFTASGVGAWFVTLQKPEWNPPNWIFAPVWTTLYVLMGIALFITRKTKADLTKKRKAIFLFGFQLLLNFFWSFIFFNQQQPGWAFLEIIVLWLAILFTILSFASISKTAAWLLVPYISWVSFAAILNYAIWAMNR